jgi:hypothetical protein
VSLNDGQKRQARELYAAQAGKCFWCLRMMADCQHSERDRLGWTREHVIPRAMECCGLKGNVVLAHKHCNNQRGSPAPDEFAIVRTMRIYDAFGRTAFSNIETTHALYPLIERCRAAIGAQAA